MSKSKAWDPAKARVDATRMLVGNYDNWPAWPKLPMRHEHRREMGTRALGVMVEEDSDTYNVYLYMMFERMPRHDRIPEEKVERFETIEDLIDAGWRVD